MVRHLPLNTPAEDISDGLAPNVNSLPLDNGMLRTVAAVQQFMTEFNGAVSEEEKIVTITKIVSNLMKQNDH
jgi:hypothetical protein